MLHCVRRLLGLLACVTCITMAQFASAQAFPTRPITVVWPYGPTAMESALRLLYAEAAKQLGQPIVSESRIGAGNRLGVMAVMQSTGDAHTLGVVTDAVLAIAPHASASFKVQPGQDYTPLIELVSTVTNTAARPDAPFQDLAGMIAYARKYPGKLNAAGVGADGQINWAKISEAAGGIVLTYIPYKAPDLIIPDLISGRVDLYVGGPGIYTFINSGKVIGLAQTGNKRIAASPNYPTMSESGLPGFTIQPWVGMVAPRGIAPEVLAKLSTALNTALKLPDVSKRLLDLGLEPVGGSPEQFAALIRADLEKNEKVVQRLGIKME